MLWHSYKRNGVFISFRREVCADSFYLENNKKNRKGREFGGASYSSTPTSSEAAAVTGFFFEK